MGVGPKARRPLRPCLVQRQDAATVLREKTLQQFLQVAATAAKRKKLETVFQLVYNHGGNPKLVLIGR